MDISGVVNNGCIMNRENNGVVLDSGSIMSSEDIGSVLDSGVL